MAPLFRDIRFPSRDDDRLAHERFLLDTHAERRAPGTQRAPRRNALAARLRALVGRP